VFIQLDSVGSKSGLNVLSSHTMQLEAL